MQALAIPEPTALVQSPDALCSAIEQWAEETTSVDALNDAKARLAAIDMYLAQTSTEGRKRVAATLRRLEVRIGQLLGPAQPGRRSDLEPLDRGQEVPFDNRTKHEFRRMAERPDVVERVIDESTDDDPPSRRKVMTAIAEEQREAEVRTDPRIVRQQERRAQVRRLHDQGYTTQEIADRLGCSVSVVQKDVSALGIGRGTGARTASPEHVTESIVNQMRAVSMACSGVDFDLIDVPPAVAAAWRADLEEGRKAITRIIRALQRKEQP